jgi:hypothetical protein
VTVAGTAEPRFPIEPNETVDELRYRIDDGNWTNLTVDDGSWNFTWDTRPYTKGTHTVEVYAKNWKDAITWSADFYVDNSPEIDIDAPTCCPTIGGVRTFEGAVRDRYTVGDNDTVDEVEVRIDSDDWQTMETSPDSDGWEPWNLTVDTHDMTKGYHELHVRGTEDNDTRVKTRDFYVDNSPELTVDTPLYGVEVGDIVILRGVATDPFPSPPNYTVPRDVDVHIDDGPARDVEVLNESASGELTWRHRINTRNLSDGSHDFDAVAYDGLQSTLDRTNVDVRNGEDLELANGATRVDYTRGAGDGDDYTIDLPTDVTRLEIRYEAYQEGSNSSMYLDEGSSASNESYTWASTGNGTVEEIDIDTLDGLSGGNHALRVEADGDATDHLIHVQWWTTDDDGDKIKVE